MLRKKKVCNGLMKNVYLKARTRFWRLHFSGVRIGGGCSGTDNILGVIIQ